MRDINEMNMPALGSPEAAVQSAVNLLAKVTDVNESRLAYYLDMYYQLRCRYECDKDLASLKEVFFPGPKLSAERPSPADPPDGGNPCEPAAPEVPDGFEPLPLTESPAAKAAAEKRRIRERFMRARENGVTVGAVRKAANGGITEESLRDIIDAKPVPVAVYRVLDKALDHLEQ